MNIARTLATSCAGAVLMTLSASAVQADPLLVRNQHPMVALFGLPAPLPARLPSTGSGAVAAVVNWTSFEATDSQGDLGYTLDGEVFETRLVADYGFGSRLALHGEVAYRGLSGGTLDGFIDSWHDAFSLPSGSRNTLPEDELLIEYRVGANARLRVEDDTSGISDLPVSLGWQVRDSERGALAAWLTVKAPTGSASDLTGSGATDVALSMAGRWQPHEHWTLFGQANVAWLGEGDVLPDLQESYAWSLLGGASWNAWRTLELTVQVEANSAVFDSGLDDFDGDAVVLAFGGSYLTQGGWQFDLGIVEDIQPDASPDFTLNFGVRRGFGGSKRD